MLRIIIFQVWDYEAKDDALAGLKPYCYGSGDHVEIRLSKDISLRSRAFREKLFTLLGGRPDVTFTIPARRKCRFRTPQNVRITYTMENMYGKYRV